jgi:hypothetical protein
MIVETKFMALDAGEVISVSLGGQMKVIFRNGLSDNIAYETPEEMQADYKKIVKAMKERHKG